MITKNKKVGEGSFADFVAILLLFFVAKKMSDRQDRRFGVKMTPNMTLISDQFSLFGRRERQRDKKIKIRFPFSSFSFLPEIFEAKNGKPYAAPVSDRWVPIARSREKELRGRKRSL